MKMTHLTKRESDVMEVFWNNDRPLAVGDIQQVISEITSNSIQPVLKKLQKRDLFMSQASLRIRKL